MSEFTKGPWEIRYGGKFQNDDGFGIAAKLTPHMGIIAESWPCLVDSTELRNEIHANARLIAQSPAMYEVIKKRRDLMAGVLNGSPEHIWPAQFAELAELDAIIAAVEGK